MADDLRTIAASFDTRSGAYARNEWHRHYAERLVEAASLQPNQRVLDAGVGTGFAAIAIARRVGAGHVVGVDVSPGMLLQARTALDAAGFAEVQLLHADATDLAGFDARTFDAVICSAALLYMPVDKALAEWHRLLKAGGTVGFSTMRRGSPPAGRLFRECAEAAGVTLDDPSRALGSEDGCRDALEAAGFRHISVVPDEITMSAVDLSLAWESNFHSARHAAVRELNAAAQERLRERYESALRRGLAEDGASFTRAHVLYAFGTRQP